MHEYYISNFPTLSVNGAMVRLEVTLRATDGTTLTPFDFEQTQLTGVTSTSSTCTVPSDVALVGWT